MWSNAYYYINIYSDENLSKEKNERIRKDCK